MGKIPKNEISNIDQSQVTNLTTDLAAKADSSTLTAHTSNTSNPHSTTAAQVGLGNVDNTSDATKNAATVSLTNKNLTSGTNTFPTFNQNTTGSAATLTTSRNIQTNLASASAAGFNGSADITPGVTGILPGANGGTNNAFMSFTGPTTSAKVYTLPNQSTTLLTSSSAVTVAQGGTGRATSTTAYGLIAAGTTATGAHQTIAPGTSGQFLKSAGTSALGAFATLSSADLSDVATLATLTGTQTLTNKTLTNPLFTGNAGAPTTPGTGTGRLYGLGTVNLNLAWMNETGSVINITAGLGAWTAWTPTWTNVSGGTLDYAKYSQAGKIVQFRLKYTLGGAGVTGDIIFTLPVTASSEYGVLANIEPIGNANLRDAGTANIAAVALMGSTTTCTVRSYNAAATSAQVVGSSATVPFTWASGDQITVSGSYEAA